MKKSTKSIKSKLFFLAVAVLLILSLNFFQNEVKSFFYLISSPIQKSLWREGREAPNFPQGIFKFNEVKKENDELRSRLRDLLSENVSFLEIKKENDLLREALGIELNKEFKLVLANVIGKEIGRDVIFLDKGSRGGIVEGLFVITSQKVILGKIIEVYENTSKVRLISSKESSFGVEVKDGEITGAARGEGSSKIILDLIPRDKELKEGDILITAPMGGDYPRGLLVGTIKEIFKSDLKPFQQAEIAPFFDIGKLTAVFIISNDH